MAIYRLDLNEIEVRFSVIKVEIFFTLIVEFIKNDETEVKS